MPTPTLKPRQAITEDDLIALIREWRQAANNCRLVSLSGERRETYVSPDYHIRLKATEEVYDNCARILRGLLSPEKQTECDTFTTSTSK